MENFGTIVDPETNQNVPVQSAVGQQVIKNYLECLKHGPDSKNILSTKMFYKNKSTSNSNEKQSTNLSKIDLYERAKKLSNKQFEHSYMTQNKFYKKNSSNINLNDIIWIKRSNGKWQLANVAKKDNNKLDVYFNNGKGQIGVKKGLKIGDILVVSSKINSMA